MIRSRIYFALVLLLSGLLSGLFSMAAQTREQFLSDELPARRQLVNRLALTDLALWTEARYTRHPSMADLFSPFQDHPAAFEHFPAGALMAPMIPRPATTLHIQRRGKS